MAANKNMAGILGLSDRDLNRLIKISGTEHDRKRKLTDAQIEAAICIHARNNVSVEQLAALLGVHPNTVRYHIYPEYREYRLTYAKLNPQAKYRRHDSASVLSERADYKRRLIADGKICA